MSEGREETKASTRRRRFGFAVLVAAAAILIAACVPPPPPPPQGTITGTLTNGTHPLPQFGLVATDTAGNIVASTNTNASGQYSMQMAPGSYKVNYLGGGPCQGEWFDNKADVATADVLNVTGGGSVTASAVLNCPTITGHVTGGNGSPLSSVRVLPVAQPPTPPSTLMAFTDSNGNYIAYVAAGTHIVHFDRGDGCVEFFNDKQGPGSADVVTVPPAGSVAVNAVLDCGTISGTVTDGVNTIENVALKVYDAGGNLVSTSLTDSSGTYAIVIAAGVYNLEFSHVDFVTEWWNDKADLASADDITVADNTTSTANAVLAPT